jgi:polysaccharide pyruvyl transferase WcaK-like protein
VIRDVEVVTKGRLPALSGDSLTCPAVVSFDDLLAVIARTDIVVASRFHGIILSFLMNRPTIGLSYYRKMDELMTDMDQSEFVADISRFDVSWLVSRFERLRANATTSTRRIELRRADYHSALESQYTLLLGQTIRSKKEKEVMREFATAQAHESRKGYCRALATAHGDAAPHAANAGTLSSELTASAHLSLQCNRRR